MQKAISQITQTCLRLLLELSLQMFHVTWANLTSVGQRNMTPSPEGSKWIFADQIFSISPEPKNTLIQTVRTHGQNQIFMDFSLISMPPWVSARGSSEQHRVLNPGQFTSSQSQARGLASAPFSGLPEYGDRWLSFSKYFFSASSELNTVQGTGNSVVSLEHTTKWANDPAPHGVAPASTQRAPVRATISSFSGMDLLESAFGTLELFSCCSSNPSNRDSFDMGTCLVKISSCLNWGCVSRPMKMNNGCNYDPYNGPIKPN